MIVNAPKSGQLTLTIDSLRPEDKANYTCKSLNKADFAEQNGTIMVECKLFMWFNWVGLGNRT